MEGLCFLHHLHSHHHVLKKLKQSLGDGSVYVKLTDKLAGSGVKVGKFRADGAQQELQLGSFPTIVFFPKKLLRPIKYPSEKRDVESLMAFVNALR